MTSAILIIDLHQYCSVAPQRQYVAPFGKIAGRSMGLGFPLDQTHVNTERGVVRGRPPMEPLLALRRSVRGRAPGTSLFQAASERIGLDPIRSDPISGRRATP
jgi:hypothetical protein